MGHPPTHSCTPAINSWRQSYAPARDSHGRPLARRGAGGERGGQQPQHAQEVAGRVDAVQLRGLDQAPVHKAGHLSGPVRVVLRAAKTRSQQGLEGAGQLELDQLRGLGQVPVHKAGQLVGPVRVVLHARSTHSQHGLEGAGQLELVQLRGLDQVPVHKAGHLLSGPSGYFCTPAAPTVSTAWKAPAS